MKRLCVYAVVCAMAMGLIVYAPVKSAEPPDTVSITLTIPTAALPRITTAMAGLYPIPMIEDPENPDEQIPEYTENQWAKMCVLQFVRRSVQRYEQKLANEAAVVPIDPTIVD